MHREPRAPRPPGRIPYSPALDGLRGIALFVMLVYHGDYEWLGGGYLSVSTFFTLSGFLITTLLLLERDTSGRIDLRDFWVRRLRRLMPAALAGLALAAAYGVFAATPSQVMRLPWDAAAALLYFANFRFMTSGHSYWELFSRPSPLQHYWSLSIEEQFYVVYPLLLILITAVSTRARATLRIAVLVLALASTGSMIALSLAGTAPARLYYGTDTRASEFLTGALLSTLLVTGDGIRPWRGRGARFATLLAAAYTIAVVLLVEQDSPFLYRGGFALYSAATAFLINAALQPGLVRSLLSLPPLPWAGAVSYGAYIYHWPIYLWLDTERTGFTGTGLLALRIAVTLVAADVSYRLLERPIRNGTRLRGIGAIAAPAAAVAGVSFLLWFAFHDAARRIDDRPTVTGRSEMPALGPPAPEGPVRVMILGDSIGWNIGEGFRRWARTSGAKVTVWNRGLYGCGLARGGELASTMAERRAAPCEDWSEWWEVDVDRFRPDVAVILSGLWDLGTRKLPEWDRPLGPGDAAFDAWLLTEYQLAVDVASSRGARVVWLTTPCIGPVEGPNPLRKQGALAPTRLEHLNRVLLPALVASRPTQVEIYDLFRTICPGGRYRRTDSILGEVRNDPFHISRKAASRIAADIAAQVFPKMGYGTESASVPRSLSALQPAQ